MHQLPNTVSEVCASAFTFLCFCSAWILLLGVAASENYFCCILSFLVLGLFSDVSTLFMFLEKLLSFDDWSSLLSILGCDRLKGKTQIASGSEHEQLCKCNPIPVYTPL